MKIPIENFDLLLNELVNMNRGLNQIALVKSSPISDVDILKRLADVEIKVSKVYQLMIQQSLATGKERLTEKGKEVSQLWYSKKQNE